MTALFMPRFRAGCLGLALALALVARAQEKSLPEPPTSEDYGFEGRLERLDPRLAPDLREGLVLSGVYSFFPDTIAEDTEEAPDRARFAHLVGEAELSFDLDHVWVYDARAGTGDSRLELARDVEADGQKLDLYALTLPLVGTPLGEAGWTPRWLQLWLYGPSGEMLPHLRPQAPPEAFRRGWWRLTFWDKEGAESATAEGPLTAAGPAGEALTPSEQIAALQAVVATLGRELETARDHTRHLEAELATARRRMEGLQSTIDLLLDERSNLRAEVTRLEAAQEETPAALQQRVADLEASAALWAEQESAWQTRQRVLAEALATSASDYARLERAHARLQAERAATSPPPLPAGASTLSSTSPEPPAPIPPPAGILVIPQAENVVEQVRPLGHARPEVAPLPVSPPPPTPPPSPPAEVESEDREASASPPSRPGKFRRRFR
jgi:hypothetical protein